MPHFRRSDGLLVKELPAMRRIMPYVMRGRNESAVYLESHIDATNTRKWMRAFNRAAPVERCTFLNLFLFCVCRGLREFPELDRFVSGRRIYQRMIPTWSLLVRDSLDLKSPTYSVKLPAAGVDESLPAFSRRIAEILRNAGHHQHRMERELTLLLRLPDFLLRLVMWLRGLLDAWNLLPARLIRDDPLYTSLFVAHLGTLGLPDTFHHLFEYGTCSYFAVLAALRNVPIANSDGTTEMRAILPIRWTLDDRVIDAFVCATFVRRVQSYMEDPAQILGSPVEAAQGRLPAPAATITGLGPTTCQP